MKKKTIKNLLLIGLLCLSGLTACSKEESIVTTPFSVGEIVTNIAQSSGKYLVSSVVIEVTDSKLIDNLTERSYVVRDAVDGVLRQCTEEQLKENDIKDELREKILATLSDKFATKRIESVFFDKFTFQG